MTSNRDRMLLAEYEGKLQAHAVLLRGSAVSAEKNGQHTTAVMQLALADMVEAQALLLRRAAEEP